MALNVFRVVLTVRALLPRSQFLLVYCEYWFVPGKENMVPKLSGEESVRGDINIAQWMCCLAEKVFEHLISSCRGLDRDLPGLRTARQGIPGVFASCGVPGVNGGFFSRGASLAGRLKEGKACVLYALVPMPGSETARALLSGCVTDLSHAQPGGAGCIVGAIKTASLEHFEAALGGGPGGVSLWQVFEDHKLAVASGTVVEEKGLEGLVNAVYHPPTGGFYSGHIVRQAEVVNEAWSQEVRARSRRAGLRLHG